MHAAIISTYAPPVFILQSHSLYMTESAGAGAGFGGSRFDYDGSPSPKKQHDNEPNFVYESASDDNDPKEGDLPWSPTLQTKDRLVEPYGNSLETARGSQYRSGGYSVSPVSNRPMARHSLDIDVYNVISQNTLCCSLLISRRRPGALFFVGFVVEPVDRGLERRLRRYK